LPGFGLGGCGFAGFGSMENIESQLSPFQRSDSPAVAGLGCAGHRQVIRDVVGGIEPSGKSIRIGR